MPSSGLGKPSADACGVTITEPQDRIGLILQDGTYDGLARMSIFSTVSVMEETSPITPAISTHHALRGRTPESRGCADTAHRHDAAGATAVSMPGTSPTMVLILATSASGVDGS